VTANLEALAKLRFSRPGVLLDCLDRGLVKALQDSVTLAASQRIEGAAAGDHIPPSSKDGRAQANSQGCSTKPGSRHPAALLPLFQIRESCGARKAARTAAFAYRIQPSRFRLTSSLAPMAILLAKRAAQVGEISSQHGTDNGTFSSLMSHQQSFFGVSS
jgi:hypothetical protein